MLGVIGQMINLIVEEWQQFYEDNLRWQDPKEKLHNQLRVMFGRGEIPVERFLDLSARLERNQIGQGDITVARWQAERLQQTRGRPGSTHRDPEIRRELNRLYADRGLVEEARQEIAAGLSAVDQELAWIQAQVDSTWQSAQSALPDEHLARAYLDARQHLLELSAALQARSLALRRERDRLEVVEAELRASITTLKLLDSRQSLAQLKLSVKQDLLPQGQKR